MLQARDTVNIDASIPFLNEPDNIEMDILDVADLNVDIAHGEESDVGSYTFILKEFFHSDIEDEVAQDAIGPHVEEDLTPLFFLDDMNEKEMQEIV